MTQLLASFALLRRSFGGALLLRCRPRCALMLYNGLESWVRLWRALMRLRRRMRRVRRRRDCLGRMSLIRTSSVLRLVAAHVIRMVAVCLAACIVAWLVACRGVLV